MEKTIFHKIFKYFIILVSVFFCIFIIWQIFKKVPTDKNWKDTLKILSTAEFKDNLVTVKNIRNFQYDSNGNPTVKNYYNKTYDLNNLKKVWYITDPFSPGSPFAHTFLSFEFNDESFLAITIEGRLAKNQSYGMLNGTLHTFPLIYIAADERDVIYVRTNIFKDGVYVYPLITNTKDGRLLLVDMLKKMNDIGAHPVWYNSINANCTSSIAMHVNKIWPGLLPKIEWQSLFTGFADKLILDKGLIETNLNINDARNKFNVTDISNKIGYVENYSILIRK